MIDQINAKRLAHFNPKLRTVINEEAMQEKQEPSMDMNPFLMLKSYEQHKEQPILSTQQATQQATLLNKDLYSALQSNTKELLNNSLLLSESLNDNLDEIEMELLTATSKIKRSSESIKRISKGTWKTCGMVWLSVAVCILAVLIMIIYIRLTK